MAFFFLIFRLIGVVVVIIGLYAVLWGKAKDHAKINENANIQTNEVRNVNISKVNVVFGNSFCFLFSKFCFWEYKETTIFLYFLNKKHVWLVEI